MSAYSIESTFKVTSDYFDMRFIPHTTIQYTSFCIFIYLFVQQGLIYKRWNVFTNIWMFTMCVQMTKCTFFYCRSLLYPSIKGSEFIADLAIDYMFVTSGIGVLTTYFSYFYLYFFIGVKKRYDLYSKIVYIVIPVQFLVFQIFFYIVIAAAGDMVGKILIVPFLFISAPLNLYGYYKLYEERKSDDNHPNSMENYMIGLYANILMLYSFLIAPFFVIINDFTSEPSEGLAQFLRMSTLYVTAFCYVGYTVGILDIMQMSVFKTAAVESSLHGKLPFCGALLASIEMK